MTIKYLHIREVDEEGNLCAGGGLTIAYTISDVEGMQQIFLNWVKCHPDDHFEYRIGRELAAAKLKDEGPFEILDLEHPISNSIVDWVCTVLWPGGAESIDMGFVIDVDKDGKGRWISDFLPAQGLINFELEDSASE